MPAALTILVAVAIAFASGGRIRSRMAVSNGSMIVLWIVFLVQSVARGRLLPALPASSIGLAVWAGATCLLSLAMWFTYRTAGAKCIAVGFALNLLVVLLNRAMPVLVSAGSAWRASGAIARSAGFYAVANQGHLLMPIADVMPVRFLGATWMLSAGDVLVMVGVIVSLVHTATAAPVVAHLGRSDLSSGNGRAPLAHEARFMEE